MRKTMALVTLLSFILAGSAVFASPLPSFQGSPAKAPMEHYTAKSSDFLTESFEFWPPQGWTLVPESGFKAWEMGLLEYGTYGPWVTEPDSGAEHTVHFAAFSVLYENLSGDMTTPAINLPNPATACSLGFYVWNIPDTAQSNNDSLILLITANSGSTWTRLGKVSGDISQWTYFAFSLESYAGQTVQVLFTAYASANGSDICIDEVWAGQKPADDAAITSVYTPLRQQLSAVNPALAVKNYGTAGISSLMADCRIDSAGVEVYHDSSEVSGLSLGETRRVELPAWTPAVGNCYDAVFSLAYPADANPDNDTMIVPTNAYTAQRKVLAMDFTATWCFDCPYMQNALHQLKQETGDSLCIMGIHIWGAPDTFCNQHTTDILAFYNNTIAEIPTVIWDGGNKTVGGYSGSYQDCRIEFDRRKAFNSPFSLGLSGAVSGDTATVNATLDYQGGVPLPVFIKLTAVEDKKLTWPGTMDPHCDSLLDILRDVSPTTAGDSLMLCHGVTNTSFFMALNPGWNRNHLKFIVYAENRTTKEVYQAGQILYAEMDGVAGEAGLPNMPHLALLQKILPNPSRSAVTISYNLDKGRRVTLGIFDITGRKVCDLVSGSQEVGLRRVRWNGLDDRGRRVSGGVYFSKLTAGSDTNIEKIILIR